MRPVIEALARSLLDVAGVSSTPPIDLHALAAFLGVSAITYRDDLVEHGRLEQTPQRAVIVIRSDIARSRQRFTLAHELAHRALAGPHKNFVAYRNSEITSNEKEEQFCDDLAAALLLPNEWVKQRFGQRTRNLSTLRHLGHLTGCSLDASLVRLREVVQWEYSLLRFRKHTNGWRFEAGAGVPLTIHGHIRSAQETQTSFENRRGERPAQIALLVHGEPIQLPATVDVNSTTALVLVDLNAVARRIDPRSAGRVSR